MTRKSHVKCTCAITTCKFFVPQLIFATEGKRIIFYIELFYNIFLAPNPLNGCLCEILNSCSCTAAHLHDTIVGEERNVNNMNTFSPSPPSSSLPSPLPLPPTTNPSTMSGDDIDLFIRNFFTDNNNNNSSSSNTSSPISIPVTPPTSRM